MKILKTTLSGILFLFASILINAQSSSDYYYGHVLLHAEELEMSEDQLAELQKRTDEVYQIRTEAFADRNGADLKETFTKLQEREDEMKTMLQSVFTTKQLANYTKILEDRIAREEELQLEYQRMEYKSGAWLAAELSEDQIDELVLIEDEAVGVNSNEGWTAHPPLSDPIDLEEKQQTILSEEQWTAYQEALALERQALVDQQLAKMEEILPLVETIFFYYKEEAFPKYQELRTRFERKVDATDRVTIKQLRATLDEFYKEILGQEFDNAMGLDDRIRAKAEVLKGYVIEGLNMYAISPMMMMGTFSGGTDAMAINEEELKKLAEKYKSDVDELSTDLKELRKQDKEKLTVLLSKVLLPNEAKRIVKRITMDVTDVIDPYNHSEIDGMKMIRTLNFLFIPPIEIDLDGKELFSPNKKYKVYPSPSNGVHTLELNLLSKREVTIELLDVNGKVLQVPFSGTLDEGQFIQNYDWRDVEGSIFYYRITTDNSSETVKFLINR